MNMPIPFSGDSGRPESASETLPGALPPGTSEILQRILAQTQLECNSESQVTWNNRLANGLREICRRHAHLGWCRDPVATELVELVLRESRPDMCQSDSEWTTLATLIADTLEESPEVQFRLERLWSKWREAC